MTLQAVKCSLFAALFMLSTTSGAWAKAPASTAKTTSVSKKDTTKKTDAKKTSAKTPEKAPAKSPVKAPEKASAKPTTAPADSKKKTETASSQPTTTTTTSAKPTKPVVPPLPKKDSTPAAASSTTNTQTPAATKPPVKENSTPDLALTHLTAQTPPEKPLTTTPVVPKTTATPRPKSATHSYYDDETDDGYDEELVTTTRPAAKTASGPSIFDSIKSMFTKSKTPAPAPDANTSATSSASSSSAASSSEAAKAPAVTPAAQTAPQTPVKAEAASAATDKTSKSETATAPDTKAVGPVTTPSTTAPTTAPATAPATATAAPAAAATTATQVKADTAKPTTKPATTSPKATGSKPTAAPSTAKTSATKTTATAQTPPKTTPPPTPAKPTSTAAPSSTAATAAATAAPADSGDDDQSDIDGIVIFRSKVSGLKVFTDPKGQDSITLDKGDDVDVQIALPHTLIPTAQELIQGRELYIRQFLSKAYPPNTYMLMSVRSASNPDIEGSVVYVPASELANMDMIDDGTGADKDKSASDGIDEEGGDDSCTTPECLAERQKRHDSAQTGGIFDLIKKDFATYSQDPNIVKFVQIGISHLYTVTLKGHKIPRYIGSTSHRHVNKKTKKVYYTYTKSPKCYRAIKDALRASGLVPSDWGGGGSAYMAATELKAFGFTNLLDDPKYKAILSEHPEGAPYGAILVYSGKHFTRTDRNGKKHTYVIGPNGHVEIKAKPSGEDGYVSLGSSKGATMQLDPDYNQWPTKRELKAILVKEKYR